MSFDSMRVGGGRCPPLVVGVLIIACTFMLCNWWTLSSTNYELIHQIDELNEQIRISVEERDICVTQHGECTKKAEDCEKDVRVTNVKLSQIDDNLSTCNQELKSFKDIDLSKTATLETLRLDKNAVEATLKTQKEENKKLEEELNSVKADLKKLKLTLDSTAKKAIPAIPIPLHLDKTLSDNRTSLNGVQNAQVNAPPNADNADIPGPDQDNSNARGKYPFNFFIMKNLTSYRLCNISSYHSDDTAAEVH
ncbi:hypothetical protein QAD02_000267 [Eretmocerus hayati]|uniref:Uncharacterized protein n=1 Tax=Eretmocerus hayati TaxID=131215 RepID=A0ACC2ND24_9HYME|nr:hypothetical protein QAD02_000267 [Eretmocerus hayati]